jgi:hypothetical protein
MKIKTFISLLVLFVMYLTNPTASVGQKPEKYIFYDIRDGHDRELRVVPGGVFTEARWEMITASYSTYLVDKPIRYSDTWLNKINQKSENKKKYGKLIFDRYALNDSSIVYLKKESDLLYADSLKRQLILSDLSNSDFLAESGYVDDIEFALNRNPSFSKQIENGKVFSKYFNLPIEAAYLSYNTDISNGLNGRYNLQFVMRDSLNKVGYFQGEFKDGIPNGFGILVTAHFNKSRMQPGLEELPYKGNLNFKMGFWRNGYFQEKPGIRATQLEYVNNWASRLQLNQLDSSKVVISDLSVNYNPDFYLNYTVPNDLTYYFEVAWPYKTAEYPYIGFMDPKTGLYDGYYDTLNLKLFHHAYFKMKCVDFFEPKYEFKLVWAEKFINDKLEALKPKNTDAKPVNEFLESYGMSQAQTYSIDDYTKIRVSPAYVCNTFYCSQFDDESKSVVEMFTDSRRPYYEEYCHDIEVLRRVHISLPLEKVKTVHVVDMYKDCEQAASYSGLLAQLIRDPFGQGNYYYVENSKVSYFAGTSLQSILNKLVDDVRIDFPLDSTKKVEVSKLISNNPEKADAIIERFASSPEFSFKPEKPLIGAWLLEASQFGRFTFEKVERLLVLAIPGNENDLYIVNLNNIESGTNYETNIKRSDFKLISDKELNIDGKTYLITSFDKDNIKFENGNVWQRAGKSK